MRRALVLAALVLPLACGGNSPSSPSATLNLGGAWTGSLQYVTSGVTVTDAVTATLTQTGTSVGGTWTAESGASGQFSNLTAAASVTGIVTISQTTLTGASCSATSAINGNASASSITLAVAQIQPTGICQWASGMQFSLRRQ